MKLQERLHEKRDTFRVNIRRECWEGVRQLRREHLISEADHERWMDSGKKVLDSLKQLLMDLHRDRQDAIKIISDLSDLVRATTSGRSESFINENNCNEVMQQITELAVSQSHDSEFLSKCFSALGNISGIAPTHIKVNLEMVVKPLMFFEHQEYLRFICEYLVFLGNILVLDQTKTSIIHLLKHSITVALLKLQKKQSPIYNEVQKNLLWFIRLFLEAINRLQLEKTDNNIGKLTKVYGSMVMRAILTAQEDPDYLKAFLKMTLVLGEELPSEVINWLDKADLNKQLIGLLMTITHESCYQISEKRITQMADMMYEFEASREKILMVFRNNIINQPSSYVHIVSEMLRRREGLSTIKSVIETNNIVLLYFEMKCNSSVQPLLKLIVEIVKAQGCLGVLEECAGIFHEDQTFREEMEDLGYQFQDDIRE